MVQPLSKQTIIPFLREIFDRRGAEEYLGEPVTIGEHMLQAAHFAQQDEHDEIVIAAALLHDIGHFTGDFIGMPLAEGTVFMEDDTDRQHERAGALHRQSESRLRRASAGLIHRIPRQHRRPGEINHGEHLVAESSVYVTVPTHHVF